MNFWDDDTIIKRFFDKVNKTEGCWEWTANKNHKGYGTLRLNGKMRMAHRTSFEIYHKRSIIEEMFILHSCDNRKCVNPLHLSEGTHQENMDDMVMKGRVKTKLTEEQIIEIKQKYTEQKISQFVLAKDYNVNQSQISRYINGKRWKRLN
jgi:hypothetical protein